MKKAREVPETARLVTRGGYQYVLLPKEFEFEGGSVRVNKYGRGVLLEPVNPSMTSADVRKWLAGLIRKPLSEDCFEGDWRNQPQFPVRRKRRASKGSGR